jgi:hypothetical protein
MEAIRTIRRYVLLGRDPRYFIEITARHQISKAKTG